MKLSDVRFQSNQRRNSLKLPVFFPKTSRVIHGIKIPLELLKTEEQRSLFQRIPKTALSRKLPAGAFCVCLVLVLGRGLLQLAAARERYGAGLRPVSQREHLSFNVY